MIQIKHCNKKKPSQIHSNYSCIHVSFLFCFWHGSIHSIPSLSLGFQVLCSWLCVSMSSLHDLLYSLKKLEYVSHLIIASSCFGSIRTNHETFDLDGFMPFVPLLWLKISSTTKKNRNGNGWQFFHSKVSYTNIDYARTSFATKYIFEILN